MILSGTELIGVLRRVLPAAEAEDLDLVARATLAAHRQGQGWAGLTLLGRELAQHRKLPAVPAGAGAFRRVRGEDSPGPLVLAGGVREVAALASRFGVAAVGLGSIGGTGRLSSYAAALAGRGLVGLVLAHSAAMVAPWGGSRPAIGTNPFCLAAARTDGLLVIDAATSEVTRAALDRHRADGAPLPAGVALDAGGRPTTEPDEAASLVARGLIGSLAGLAIEVLAGALLGGEDGTGRGVLVVAFDPASVGTDLAAEVDVIATRWQQAGGHLPGAADQLPTQAEVDRRDWAGFLAQVAP